MEEYGLQADELEHGEEHADDGALGVGVVEQLAEADGFVFHEQAAFDVVDHLGDGDGVLVDVEDGARLDAVEDVLEDADEVDGVGVDLLGFVEFAAGEFAGVAAEVAEARDGPGGFFDLLLLHEHLGGGFEALVLEEALDEFAAWVFGVCSGDVGWVAGQESLGLDVDEERGHVDELAGGVYVGLLELVGVLEELAGDAGDGDIVDVDVLLADEIEEQVEWAVVDLAYGDGEGGLRGFFAGFVFGVFAGFGFGGRGNGLGLEGEWGGVSLRSSLRSFGGSGCFGIEGFVGHELAETYHFAHLFHGNSGAGCCAGCAVGEDIGYEGWVSLEVAAALLDGGEGADDCVG